MAELTTALPSEDLIFLVNGHRDQGNFAASRGATVENIVALLAEAQIDHLAFNSILDFGCGCGRILAGWEPYLRPELSLRGVDINQSLVDFCQQNIPFAEVRQSPYVPPLAGFPDASFDFIYAASVFTHLDQDSAVGWANEFARLTRPGGIVMMSFHGSWYDNEVERLSSRGRKLLRKRGFFMHLHGRASQTWCGSNYYASFMTQDFCNSLFSKFRLMKTLPGAERGPNPFASYQDICIYQRL